MLTVLFYLCAYAFGLFKALSGKPIWGLYVYFLCFYFHAPSQWWGESLPEFRWALIASVITLIALLLNPPKDGFRFWKFRENRWLLALAIFVFIQWPFSINPVAHFEYAFLLLKFMLFIFIFQNTVQTTNDLRGIVLINLFGGFFLSYLGMNQHTGGRLEGIGTPGMESANQLGQHLAVLVIIGGYFLLEKFRKSHVLVAGAIGLILMALFLTESRGVIASLFLVGLIGAFFRPKGSSKKLAMFGVLAVLSCSMLMGPQIVERFEGLQEDSLGEVEDASARSRFVIINAQIEMFKDSPYFGHGHAGTFMLSPSYIPPEYHAQNAGGRSSHNVVMAFLVDHGAVGAFFYFAAIMSVLWRIWEARKIPLSLNEDEREEYKVLCNLKVGFILAMLSFMMSGMGSNNKKLEADIWVLAIVPVISRRMQIMTKESRDRELMNKDVIDVNGFNR